MSLKFLKLTVNKVIAINRFEWGREIEIIRQVLFADNARFKDNL